MARSGSRPALATHLDCRRLVDAIAAALPGRRSPAELYDAFLTTLRAELGPTVLVSLYVEAEGRLWLEGQSGYPTVVHTIPLDHGVFGRAMRTQTFLLIADPGHDPDYRPIVADVSVVAAFPFRLIDTPALIGLESVGQPLPEWIGDALAEATSEFARRCGALSPRARAGSATTRLSRAFVRLAAQDDPMRLLELACRTVGGMLSVDAVQAFTIQPNSGLEAATLWRRSHSSLAGVDATVAQRLGDLLLWEPGQLRSGDRDSPAIAGSLTRAGISSLQLLPLRSTGDLIGVLVGASTAETPVPLDMLEQAEMVAAHAAATYANLQRYQTMVAASLTDALTGLANHRRFYEDGAALLDACRATDASFALVICDLDDFKDLNDRQGHMAGDDALRLVGGLLATGVRPDDRAYRLGGEEFALLLPVTDKANARTVCRRLQRLLAQVDVAGWRLTVSMGIAGFPGDGETLHDLASAADAALFEAKRLGKDRITLADERLVARRHAGDSMAARGRRSFEQMRHLQRLAAALAGSHTAEAVGQAVLNELADALPHDASGLVIGDGAAARVVAASGVGSPSSASLLTPIARRAIESCRAFLIDDVSQEPALSQPGNFRGAVAAPLVADDRVVGAVVVLSKHWSRYDRDDQRLLEVVGHIGGLACENLSLLETRSRSQDTLLGLSERLAACTSDREIIDTAVGVLHELLGPGAAVLRGIGDPAGDGAREPFAEGAADADGSLVLALTSGSRVMGVIELREHSEAERTLARRVTHQASLALACLRLSQLELQRRSA